MLLLTFALAVLVATGCVGTLEPFDPGGGGGGPDGGTTGGAARQLFDDDVAPMIGICSSCHTGPAGTTPLKFMGTGGVANYYSAIIGQPTVTGNFIPANASLLNKGAHEGVLAWDTTQAAAISAWLLAEADERN
jgi:hypothetical protein